MKKILTSKWFLFPAIILLSLVIYVNYQLAYSGTSEIVTFKSNDIEIKGVLVHPKTPGPHPAVVLLQGSGGSHQGYDKWYNRFHANVLVDRGFAVLAYTKRGSGNNNVDYEYVTFEDLINDALSAVNFLRSRPHIDGDKIGLMGISESGWFTPEIALLDGNIKFIINRVSSPLSFHETTLHEIKMEALDVGFTDREIEDEIIPFIGRIRKFYIAVAKDPSLSQGTERTAIDSIYLEMQKRDRFRDFFQSKLTDYDARLYRARASRYAYDPQSFLKQIDLPMLYILAGKDVNIPTVAGAEYLERLKEQYGKDITLIIYPKADHYLYRWKALPLEGLYVRGYLDLIANWAAEQVD